MADNRASMACLMASRKRMIISHTAALALAEMVGFGITACLSSSFRVELNHLLRQLYSLFFKLR